MPNVDDHGSPTGPDDSDSALLRAFGPLPGDVADDAREMVYGDRHRDYGSPERNLTKIGMVWGALLGIEAIPPRQVAVMMAGLKLVRASGRDNRDDLVDGIGYLMLADEAAE